MRRAGGKGDTSEAPLQLFGLRHVLPSHPDRPTCTHVLFQNGKDCNPSPPSLTCEKSHGAG